MVEEEKDEQRKIRKRYSPEIFRGVHLLSPFDMLRNLREELEMMDRGYGNFIWSSERPYRPFSTLKRIDFPHTELFDEGDNLRIIVEIPGGNKDDLELEMEEDHFRIHAVTKVEKCVEHAYFVRCEKKEKMFEREIKLPIPVDPHSAVASFQNDILEIEVAKKREEKKRTKIKID